MTGSRIKTMRIKTPLGHMIAGATSEGICLLEFHDSEMLQYEYKYLSKALNSSFRKGFNRHLWRLKKEVKEYFKGTRKEFSVLTITTGSDFQKETWKELQKIPYGSTSSYNDIALILNKPDAARAVASANRMNRISIVIPCHRVIGADGDLTGYRGGLNRKKKLLDHEKKFSGQDVELSLF